MKLNSSFAKLVFALAATAIIIGFSALSQQPNDGKDSFRKKQAPSASDTGKPGKLNRNGTFDNLDRIDIEMKHLDVEMQKLDDEMRNLDLKINQKEIDKALKSIDVNKINTQIDESLQKIDWSEINNNLNENGARVQKVQMKQIEKQLENLQHQLENQKNNLHFDLSEIDAGKMKVEIEKAMKDARKSIEKAKEELKNIKDFTDALQSDGLINKLKPYKVEVKDGELYINGKKQTKEVNDKYRKYYKSDHFTINTSDEDDTEI